MRVGIVGSGRIGGNAGTQLARAGHEVMFSSRHLGSLRELASGAPGAVTGRPEDAVAFGDAVILAVPWGYQRDVAEGRVDGDIAMFVAAEDQAAAEAASELIAACRFHRCRSAAGSRFG